MINLNGARILMYSHDTFGLGHLRRCRTIAHSLVEHYSGLSVLIISGSAIAGAFDFRSRVDFVKIPSVIKLRNGEYTSLDQHIDIADTIRMRESIVLHTAKTFNPDVFIVDKEPMGLKGEITETLRYLKSQGTQLVLGLRDVMDSPKLLKAEWERKELMSKIESTYDHIWVYGPKNFYNPLVGLDVPESVNSKIQFAGFLKRQVSHGVKPKQSSKDNYILVTAGGGGDGVELIRSVLSVYEKSSDKLLEALFVLGPYMPSKERDEFVALGKSIPGVKIIGFDARMEDLIFNARAVVGMGGYNTFCEILSFDKPALIVPRTVPREEQLIRTTRAAELDLVDMILPVDADDPNKLLAALVALPDRPKPSQRYTDFALDGLTCVVELLGKMLSCNCVKAHKKKSDKQ